MRTDRTAACAVVATLLAAVRIPSGFAGEADPPADDPGATPAAPSDTVAAEFERLGHEYEQLVAAREEVIPLPRDANLRADTTLPDQQWLKQRLAKQASAPDPNSVLPKFVAFAQQHSTSPLAFDALFFVVLKTEFNEFRGDGMPSPVLGESLELAWADHKDDPRIVHLLARLEVPSFYSESFLKRALQNAPNRAVRAAACLALLVGWRKVRPHQRRFERGRWKSLSLGRSADHPGHKSLGN